MASLHQSILRRKVLTHPSSSHSFVLLLFLFLAFLIGLLFFMGSSQHPDPLQVDHEHSLSQQRIKLYEKMAVDLQNQGAKFLDGGLTSQSLKVSEIFTLKNGRVYPNLKPAEPPVRATVLYLNPYYAESIYQIVKRVFSPHYPEAIWYQDPNLYHFSMFHASHHLEPVFAKPDEVEVEAQAIENITRRCCPLSIYLERVVLTSTGVLLGCWQVIDGTDPYIIRGELKKVLPHSPKKQLYDPVILHTTFARILGPPQVLAVEIPAKNTTEILYLFSKLVSQLNSELYQFKAKVEDLWFVEELDILALALHGRIKVKKFQFGCLSR